MGLGRSNIVLGSTMFDGSVLETGQSQARQQKTQAMEVLFMSRVERNKGVFELIDAIGALIAENRAVHLTVAGDGTALSDAKEYAQKKHLSEHISFLGYVRSPSEKAELMHSAQVFCLPTSHDEGLPVSLMEAMGAGLAVISTRVGGIPEALGEHGGLLLSNPVDAAHLTSAIRTLLDDPASRESMQTNNRKRAWQRYEATAVAKRIEAIYQAVARDDFHSEAIESVEALPQA